MSQSTGLARRPAAPSPQQRQAPLQQQQGSGAGLALRLAPPEWTREYLQVLKDTYAKRTTDAEFALAVQVSKATGLRIDTHELWVYKRGENEPVTITISVDGFRAIAHSSGVYAGEEGPFWCGKDGVWRDVWLDDQPPRAAKFIVWRTDFPKPFVAIILLAEFRNGSPFWKDRPVHQSGVRAATHAFRKAFRQEIGAVQERAQTEGVALAEPDEATPPETAATEYAPRLVDARTGEILDAQAPEPEPDADEDGDADAQDAEDVAYIEAASVRSSSSSGTKPAPVPVQAPLLDAAPAVAVPPGPDPQPYRRARAALVAAEAATGVTTAPKSRSELLAIYRQWVKRAIAAGVNYTPETNLEGADDAQFQAAAVALVRAVKEAEARPAGTERDSGGTGNGSGEARR